MNLGLPWWLSGKESTCHAGDVGDSGLIPGWGRSPGEENSYSLQYSPGKFHEQRSLAGPSPWGCKEADTTELLSRHNGSELKLLGRAVMEGGAESKEERERERERKFVLN